MVNDTKINISKNTYFIHKRYQPRIFCLQKLRSLNVIAAVLPAFYQSCIESVLTFSFLCWFGGLNVKSKNVLNKLMNVCGKVYLNEILFCSAVSSIFKQIKSVQTSEQCVYVCKWLVCLLCNFCIFNNCSLSFKIYNIVWNTVLFCYQ